MATPSIYILVRGGVVQAVRTKDIPPDAGIHVFDMDDVAASVKYDAMNQGEAEYELYGETWSEIEEKTDAQY